jgi:hypothetical protein
VLSDRLAQKLTLCLMVTLEHAMAQEPGKEQREAVLAVAREFNHQRREDHVMQGRRLADEKWAMAKEEKEEKRRKDEIEERRMKPVALEMKLALDREYYQRLKADPLRTESELDRAQLQILRTKAEIALAFDEIRKHRDPVQEEDVLEEMRDQADELIEKAKREEEEKAQRAKEEQERAVMEAVLREMEKAAASSGPVTSGPVTSGPVTSGPVSEAAASAVAGGSRAEGQSDAVRGSAGASPAVSSGPTFGSAEEREKWEREMAGTVMRVMEEIMKREGEANTGGSRAEGTAQSDVAAVGPGN